VSPELTAAVLLGATGGLGATLIVRELLPSDPQLAAALDRLAPTRIGADAPAVDEPAAADGSRTGGLEHRVGIWAQRYLADAPFVRIPTTELLLLRIPVARHLGQKVLMALLGLAFPAVFLLLTAAAGAALPIALPAVSALVLAAVLFVVPDLDVARKAVAAREEFARATSAYLDLTALERAAGAGATQSLEQAATVGDSWVFVRLREQLVRARLSGRPPWDGLHELSHELGLPELTDLADIMRLSGEEGAAVADTLRARSRGLRAALLTREQTRANEESERMVIPVALLGLIFLVILGAPAIVRIL
jgi:Flp pilus assembly protein TadB